MPSAARGRPTPCGFRVLRRSILRRGPWNECPPRARDMFVDAKLESGTEPRAKASGHLRLGGNPLPHGRGSVLSPRYGRMAGSLNLARRDPPPDKPPSHVLD